ncbi:MAG: cyclic lactone autoinducer peptide [Lachnospiraceae bacterium]|nr:cyclic lactone autoinducer peptide [Lachnospiraceae bacterium]
MKKSNLKTSVLRVVQKAIGSEVEKNNSGNSFCIGILHQPKRPQKNNKKGVN